MREFHLASEFSNPDGERALLAAICRDPAIYYEILDLLPADAFANEPEAWRRISTAIESEQPVPSDLPWTPAEDPRGTAQALSEMSQLRRLAAVSETLGAALFAKDRKPAARLLEDLESELARVRLATQADRSGSLHWASDLLVSVIETALRLREEHESGKALEVGIRTGIARLDEATQGLRPGLTVLAGGPGVGKTTLALQIASTAAKRDSVVLYVTYENPPSNLVLKLLCADSAGCSPSDVERGVADPQVLEAAIHRVAAAVQRIAIVEGTAQLTVGQLRGRALQAMARHGAKRCFIVFDYLQRAAHHSGYEQLRHNVSALSGELRDLAIRLDSPLLSISSQNRAAGAYRDGRGSAALDSLKESGDLEYDADLVLFLCNSDRDDVDAPARSVDLVLAKNRYGEAGVSIPLLFRPDLGVLQEQG